MCMYLLDNVVPKKIELLGIAHAFSKTNSKKPSNSKIVLE